MMKAEISLSQIWQNPSIQVFFLLRQAINEFRALVEETSEDIDLLFDRLEEISNYDADELSELLHNEEHDNIKSMIGDEYFGK